MGLDNVLCNDNDNPVQAEQIAASYKAIYDVMKIIKNTQSGELTPPSAFCEDIEDKKNTKEKPGMIEENKRTANLEPGLGSSLEVQ